jgi:Tfp pilus assembly protein PilZ
LSIRVRFSEPVAAQPVSGLPTAHRNWSCLADNLSEGGVQLLSPELIAVDTGLLLSIEPGPWTEPIQALGHVAWVAQTRSPNRWTIGVSFTDLADGARRRLRSLIASRKPR